MPSIPMISIIGILKRSPITFDIRVDAESTSIPPIYRFSARCVTAAAPSPFLLTKMIPRAAHGGFFYYFY